MQQQKNFNKNTRSHTKTQSQKQNRGYGRDSKNNLSVMTVCCVKDIDLQLIKPERAGVVLYTYDRRGELFFAFGNDTKTNEVTDFAGRVNYKKKENVISGALRECKEETLGMYFFDEKSVQDCHCIHDSQNLIIFIPISGNHPLNISTSFKQLYVNKCEEYKKMNSKKLPEVSAILWLSVFDMEKSIKKIGNNIMFSRLRNFLIKIGSKKITSLLVPDPSN